MSHFLSPIFAAGFFESEAVQIALGVGTLVAVVAGVVGVFTVMRSQSFAGEAFGDLGTTGGAGAYFVGVGPLWGFVLGNVIAAGAMEAVGVQRARGRDVATGIVLGAGLGLAALFLHLYTTAHSTTGAIVTILFGSVFTISSATIPLILALSAVVLAITLTIYRPLLLSSVNAEMAAARGIPVRLVGVLYLLALAIAAALAAITIGTILSTALIVGPAASALRITRRPLTALLAAAGIGVGAIWLGIVLAYDSYYWTARHTIWPVSFFVVSIVFTIYLLSGLPEARRSRRAGRTPPASPGRTLPASPSPGPSPSPSPGPSPSPSPGPSPSPSPGRTQQSPSPSPGRTQQSPSPSPLAQPATLG